MRRVMWIVIGAVVGGTLGFSASKLAGGGSPAWWIGVGISSTFVLAATHHIAYLFGCMAELNRLLNPRQ
ncbi:hypothetical protein LCGC14_1198010 [marine sediment metagenome]|uniref:Uncharacterized protein n=1 Tax=marine sediment metagenome TaxID=412755 RepID=A0A0F9P073_9ZZZZ